LKDVPGLGYLFKSDSRSEDMEEVLIFITPHVLKTEAANRAVPAVTAPEQAAPPVPGEAPAPMKEEAPGTSPGK